jgi:hypothetical protein
VLCREPRPLQSSLRCLRLCARLLPHRAQRRRDRREKSVTFSTRQVWRFSAAFFTQKQRKNQSGGKAPHSKSGHDQRMRPCGNEMRAGPLPPPPSIIQRQGASLAPPVMETIGSPITNSAQKRGVVSENGPLRKIPLAVSRGAISPSPPEAIDGVVVVPAQSGGDQLCKFPAGG